MVDGGMVMGHGDRVMEYEARVMRDEGDGA